jgi:carboxyl-terminal processing protease
MFIQAGQVIVTTKDRDRRTREEYRGSGRGLYQHLPLVVLVNRGSASASEIVAACLQDNGRAKVVGQRTWGKGTVQHVIPVEGGQSVLRLTTASYWRPNGRNIHRFKQSTEADSWGVQPDEGCEVAMDDKQFAAWLEERRRRDVVYPPGKAPADRKVEDATDFDPVLKRAVELLEKPAEPAADGTK